MEVHANAPLSPIGRRRVVDRVVVEGWSVAVAAEAAGVSERTVYRWLARFSMPWSAGSCRPAVGAWPDPAQDVGRAGVGDLRAAPASADRSRDRRAVANAALDRFGGAAARRAGEALATGAARAGQPLRAFGCGGLVHIDIKKLGRIEGGPGKRITGRRSRWRGKTDAAGVRRQRIGWEYLHVAIDDYSRLAYAEVLDNEKASTAIAFLHRAVAFFAGHGICVERVMTDNGSAYISHAHAIACRELDIRHLRTRPYRPRTNGKAERLIQTMLQRWAYARAYSSSAERAATLKAWLNHYNFTRPHGSLSHKPPGSRLTKAPRNDT